MFSRRSALSSVRCAHRRNMANATYHSITEDGFGAIDHNQQGEILERLGGSESSISRTLLLNRPKALNALNQSMCQKLYRRLLRYENTDRVATVMLRSTTKKAFCAGGDVKGVATAAHVGDYGAGDDFFRTEYKLNYLLGTLKTTRIISLIDGICMGGGAGLSIHGNYTIATDTTVFAMPECIIGFAPDVGATYFLSRLPKNLGPYLALTGARMEGAATVAAGLATHYVRNEHLDDLEARIASIETGPQPISDETLNQAIMDFSEPVAGLDFYPHIDIIERCFAKGTVEDIMAELGEVGGQGGEAGKFVEQTLQNLLAGSPTSLKLALESLKRGREKNFKECLEMEYSMAAHLIREPNFYEGIRAALIDKDRNPQWNQSLTAVPSDLSGYFALPDGIAPLFSAA